jgi:hypothetical protein
MKQLIIILIMLMGCSRATVPVKPPIPAKRLPIVSTLEPSLIYKQVDIDSPQKKAVTEFSGVIEDEGSSHVIYTGLMWSAINANVKLDAGYVNAISFEPALGTMSSYDEFIPGMQVHTRAYAINNFGTTYGELKTVIVCKRPDGLKQFGLYHALLYPENKLFVFFHSKPDLLDAITDWSNPDKDIVEIKGSVAHASELQVGYQVFYGNNASCDTYADGFYLHGEVPPYKLIGVRNGFISNVTDL